MRNITNKERRMCLGKIGHKSELAAKEYENHTKGYSKTPEALGYYKCPFCKLWHVGNSQKNI